MATKTGKGTVIHIAVEHDDWCRIFKGGECNCSQEILTDSLPAPSNGEALQIDMMAYGRAFAEKNDQMMAESIEMVGKIFAALPFEDRKQAAASAFSWCVSVGKEIYDTTGYPVPITFYLAVFGEDGKKNGVYFTAASTD